MKFLWVKLLCGLDHAHANLTQKHVIRNSRCCENLNFSIIVSVLSEVTFEVYDFHSSDDSDVLLG
jgi:hypothetical protein